MKKTWSISTTVRNPERIKSFLQVLSEFEGVLFDETQQIKFQTKLIQNRLYRPNGLNEAQQKYYSSSKDMSFSQAKEIFQHMRSNSTELDKDPGLRGRTSAAPLGKMGLAIIKRTRGNLKITDFGKKFLSGEYDLGDVFLRYFYNWSLHNPDDNNFSQENGFNIRPFIGIINLISLVNKKSSDEKLTVKGISKEEFAVYGTTLIDYNNISEFADRIIALRKELVDKSKQEQKVIKKKHYLHHINGFFEDEKGTNYDLNFQNLKDYGDNAIRYFKLTRFFYIRGGGFYLDLEPRRKIEITALLNYSNAERLELNTIEDYYQFIEKEEVYPWETKDKLTLILKYLIEEINSKGSEILSHLNIKKIDLSEKQINEFSISEMKSNIFSYRRIRTEIQEYENHIKLFEPDEFRKVIADLENIRSLDNQPIKLEHLTTLSLHAINDALKIKPNYPVGDDNEPTFTAPANVPDIECYYTSFNLVCEVTMLGSRDQWINEGQPVMRHLRDFEDLNSDSESLCLFIAPLIHRDTFNTFNTSNKHDYEGKKQKIIPLSISQFVELLKVVLKKKIEKKPITKEEFKALLDKFYNEIISVANIEEWHSKSNSVIKNYVETGAVC